MSLEERERRTVEVKRLNTMIDELPSYLVGHPNGGAKILDAKRMIKSFQENYGNELIVVAGQCHASELVESYHLKHDSYGRLERVIELMTYIKRSRRDLRNAINGESVHTKVFSGKSVARRYVNKVFNKTACFGGRAFGYLNEAKTIKIVKSLEDVVIRGEHCAITGNILSLVESLRGSEVEYKNDMRRFVSGVDLGGGYFHLLLEIVSTDGNLSYEPVYARAFGSGSNRYTTCSSTMRGLKSSYKKKVTKHVTSMINGGS